MYNIRIKLIDGKRRQRSNISLKDAIEFVKPLSSEIKSFSAISNDGENINDVSIFVQRYIETKENESVESENEVSNGGIETEVNESIESMSEVSNGDVETKIVNSLESANEVSNDDIETEVNESVESMVSAANKDGSLFLPVSKNDLRLTYFSLERLSDTGEFGLNDREAVSLLLKRMEILRPVLKCFFSYFPNENELIGIESELNESVESVLSAANKDGSLFLPVSKNDLRLIYFSLERLSDTGEFGLNDRKAVSLLLKRMEILRPVLKCFFSYFPNENELIGIESELNESFVPTVKSILKHVSKAAYG